MSNPTRLALLALPVLLLAACDDPVVPVSLPAPPDSHAQEAPRPVTRVSARDNDYYLETSLEPDPEDYRYRQRSFEAPDDLVPVSDETTEMKWRDRGPEPLGLGEGLHFNRQRGTFELTGVSGYVNTDRRGNVVLTLSGNGPGTDGTYVGTTDGEVSYQGTGDRGHYFTTGY